MSLLAARGLSKRFGITPALAEVDLDVPAGSRTAIVGPSGSGKTTLLRLIGGFDAPDAGSIMLAGRVLTDARTFVPAHRRGIGFVPQEGALFPHLSVAGNIGFGLDRRSPGGSRRIRELSDAVGLEPKMLARRPHELSGGQQQRVALARSLAQQPSLMLLDEPFSALDADLRANMRRVVAEVLGAAGTTAVLVTHDRAEAMSFADQIVVLRRGRVAQAGPPPEVYLRPRDRETAAFLGDAIVLPAELRDGFVECSLGRIAADTAGRRGRAEIMLRPEQVRLTPALQDVAASQSDAEARFARISRVEYGGATSTVEVRLADGQGDALVTRCASVDAPAIGARVRVGTVGRAHVLRAETLAADQVS